MPDVDAVVFAAPRYCVIDAIQAIGRGLRQPPGAGKKTTLVIPVYLHNGADIAGLLHDSQFANLLTLLQALRAHDGSFMDRIALPARTRAARTRSSAGGRDVFYAQPERAAQLARVLGCSGHAAVPGAADLVLADWEPFDPAVYHQHIRTRLPSHTDPTASPDPPTSASPPRREHP
ncbi:hypothetical protein ACIO6U_15465 [Streptomyces sp. NPDC087422]|uniref:hypothetical protein n=1 Tax=Streptomyces sp. NPDC087422 TaxID=3365786 RepID=UPI0038285653